MLSFTASCNPGTWARGTSLAAGLVGAMAFSTNWGSFCGCSGKDGGPKAKLLPIQL